MPVGADFTVNAISFGTNNLVWRKPTDAIVNRLPFISKDVRRQTAPYGWKTKTPSLVVWGTLKGNLTWQSPEPEFVIVNAAGAELRAAATPNSIRFKTNMTTISETRGPFAVFTNVPSLKKLRIRVYESSLTNRVKVTEFEVANPAY